MSRIDLIKTFGEEDAETFNKCSTAYEMGRVDEQLKLLYCIQELESRVSELESAVAYLLSK